MAEDIVDSIMVPGGDSRYYLLNGSCLPYQLRGDLSIQASSAERPPTLIRQRIKLLESAIRTIDLE